MRRMVQLQAVTRQNRHEVNRFVNDTVLACGGWVDDMVLYSNLMSTFRLTLPKGAFASFASSLSDYGITVELPDQLTATEGDRSEQPASLQITFVHDEPDMRRPIPAVPG